MLTTFDNVKLGNLTSMLTNLSPAVASVKTAGDRSSKNHDFVQAVAIARDVGLI